MRLFPPNAPGKTVCILFLSFCLLTYRQHASAQPSVSYIFHRLTQSQGLLHTSIRSIVQDAKGYIWILSPNGLQRYDGSRFVNYPYHVTSSGGIIDTRTASLFSDKKNNCLWIVDKVSEKFDLKRHKFSSYSPGEMLKNNHFQFERYTDSLNNSWLAGNFGIFPDKPFANMARSYLSASHLAGQHSMNFFTDTLTGQTWMVDYWHGLLLLDKRTGRVYTHNYNPLNDPFLKSMDKVFLTGIMKDSHHNIWIQTNTPDFYRYNTQSGKLSLYSLKNINPLNNANDRNTTLFVETFFEDNHHAIWITTANAGLLKYDMEKDAFITIVDEEKTQKGLYYNYSIHSIFQDKDENIWLGTDKGISIFNPYRQHFKVLRHEENNPFSLPKEELQAFIQAKNGDIFVGTWGGGITIYDSSWNYKKTIRLRGPFQYNLIWSFIENDDGTIWAGCQHGYIHIYDPLSGDMRTIHPPEMNNFTIKCMKKDREGNIWFGLHNGKIAQWNKKEKGFYSYNDGAKQLEQEFKPVVNIFFDSRQRCWVSTEFGLKQFDTEKRVYSAVYVPNAKDTNSISASIVNGIEDYNDSTLLVGTLHGGLNLFNTRMKTFSRLPVTEELSSNTVFAIRKDHQGNFWLATDYGVFKYIPMTGKIIRYRIEPGIVNSSFNSTNFVTLQNGEWGATTLTELIRFHPASLSGVDVTKNRVEITGLKIFNTHLFIDSLLESKHPVRLNYQQNFLTIEFSLLNFSNQHQTNYYYKLTGVNNDWVNTNTKQFATYTGLEPGQYTFSVKADNGNEISDITSFRILITPPIWKTWWFRLLVFLSAVLIIVGLVRRRIRSIKQQSELKQKLGETEMMALRSQMNPHFIFNCLNAIDSLIQTNQPDKATTYLSRFSRLIRYLLESSKNNLIPFYKDFEMLNLYLQLEQFRAGNKFAFVLEASKELSEGDYKVPPLIIQPFVENAIQHGLLNKQTGDRKLLVQAALKSNHIVYTISDNGVGRTRAGEIKSRNRPEQKSYGIEISSDRIRLHNGNDKENLIIRDIADGDETGTEVQVRLKV